MQIRQAVLAGHEGRSSHRNTLSREASRLSRTYQNCAVKTCAQLPTCTDTPPGHLYFTLLVHRPIVRLVALAASYLKLRLS